jgi:hypothetical protein
MQTTNETVTYINGITFDSVYTITYSITFLETTLCIKLAYGCLLLARSLS